MRRDALRRQLDDAQAAARKRKEAEATRAELTAMRDRQQAALLTGLPLWDRYLLQLDALQEPDRAELSELERRQMELEFVDSAELSRRHYRMAVLRARLEARTECARLPQRIIAAEEIPEADLAESELRSVQKTAATI